MKPKTCVVTGSSGYAGAVIAAALVRAGWDVRAWTRRDFDLKQPNPAPDFSGVDALVHVAWDFSVRGLQEERRVNVAGSQALLRAATSQHVRNLLFISTLSAFGGCRSQYGQAKLEVEREVLAQRGVVLRPGLLWGGAQGGLVAKLAALARWTPLLPVPAARQPMYLCHVEDLATVVAWLLENDRDFITLPIPFAHPQPLRFADVLQRLAADHGHRPLLLPAPVGPLLLALQMAERLGVRSRLRSDSLTGLTELNPNLDFGMADLALPTPRPFRGQQTPESTGTS